MDSPEQAATATVPKQASALKVHDLVMVRDRPAKIVEISASQPGKHGSAKVTFVALDIFTDRKLEGSERCDKNVEVPVVTTSTYQVMYISDDGFLTLLDDKGHQREDLRAVPEVVKKFASDADTVSIIVMSACGEERIVRVK